MALRRRRFPTLISWRCRPCTARATPSDSLLELLMHVHPTRYSTWERELIYECIASWEYEVYGDAIALREGLS